MLQETPGVEDARRDPASVSNRTEPPRVDDAAEDAYWREHYANRDYADETLGYDQYRPAYRYGWNARAQHQGRRWDQVERELQRGWRENRGVSRLGWNDARLCARDAWQRVDRWLADLREEQMNADAAERVTADARSNERM